MSVASRVTARSCGVALQPLRLAHVAAMAGMEVP